jgi:hypothetical protein
MQEIPIEILKEGVGAEERALPKKTRRQKEEIHARV